MKSIRFLMCTSLLSVCCAKLFAAPCTPATQKPEWTRNAVIYEVNLRQFTPEGTLQAFAQQLPYLKELGVDILWLMPVHPIGEKNRKGELGSYYSVQDYTAVNPEFGTLEDFKSLVQQAHSLGMHLMIDWVANHTACDHRWTREHPERYVHKNGQFVSPADWTDTYQLDYQNPDTRQAMYEAMLFWVKECDIDGFRCDVADWVPVDFWNEVIPKLKQEKPLFFLAESSKPAYSEHAFDMQYNFPLMFLLDDVAAQKVRKGQKEAPTVLDVQQLVCKLDSVYPCDAYLMNQITNHDRNSWDGTEFERYGEGVKACAILSYTLPGMPLLYTGQESGMNRRFAFFQKDTPAPLEKNEWFRFYQQLNRLKHEYAALRAGMEGGTLVTYPNCADVAAWVYSRKGSDGKEVLVFVNASKHTITFETPQQPITGQYTNYFTGETREFKAGERFTMQAWEYWVFVR